jgi:4-diphosphocytidyl-2-C-methyl-D-erythritol kinase
LSLQLIAPAKLNLTLEVLGKREDGYHEIRSVMQTIDVYDRLTLSPGASIGLFVSGPEAAGVPEDPTRDLAYRAAVALRDATGRTDLGARIELEKRIPAGAGLGGGSSDAAAVLRGLNRLWELGLDDRLPEIAASLGSDVAFFLKGGTALVSGRGETVEPREDLRLDLVLFTPHDTEMPDKTKRMYGALRPEDYSDGSRTQALLEARHDAGRQFFNSFDRAIAEMAPAVGAAMRRCLDAGVPVIAAGAGPSFFTPTAFDRVPASLISALESEYGITARACRTLSSAEALATLEA